MKEFLKINVRWHSALHDGVHNVRGKIVQVQVTINSSLGLVFRPGYLLEGHPLVDHLFKTPAEGNGPDKVVGIFVYTYEKCQLPGRIVLVNDYLLDYGPDKFSLLFY